MKTFIFYSMFFSCLLMVNCCEAKVWKVASVKEILNALPAARPGDILEMKNGTWKNANIVFKANGTKQKPITLISETAGRVILTGQSRIDIRGNNLIVSGLYFNNEAINEGSIIHFASSSQNCRVTNIAIINDQSAGKNVDIKWVVVEGSYNRIDHSFFKNKLSKGPLISVVPKSTPNYCLIDSNYFGFRPAQGFNGAEIIRLGSGETQLLNSVSTVAYNYFEECNGENEIISSKSSGNVFVNNTFKRCQGTLSLRVGNNNIVDGNFFLGEGVKMTGGVKVFGENHKIINNYFAGLRGKNLYSALAIMNGSDVDTKTQRFVLFPQVKNITVENNFFIDNTENVVMGINYSDEKTRNLAPDSLSFNNNIFYKINDDIVQTQSAPKNVKWDKNILFAVKKPSEQDGFTNIDPKLQQSEDSIWRPTAESPEITREKSKLRNSSVNSANTINTPHQFSDKPLTGKEVGPSFLNSLL